MGLSGTSSPAAAASCMASHARVSSSMRRLTVSYTTDVDTDGAEVDEDAAAKATRGAEEEEEDEEEEEAPAKPASAEEEKCPSSPRLRATATACRNRSGGALLIAKLHARLFAFRSTMRLLMTYRSSIHRPAGTRKNASA